MTPTELALYQLTAFDLGDLVEIDESDLIGMVDGFRVVVGSEDEYLVRYHDNCGNPQRQWWPASALESADEPESNVIPFPTVRKPRGTTIH